LRALGTVWQRGWRLSLLCFALGICGDLALSPFLLPLLPLDSATPPPFAPTLAAWWFLTPLLLAHSLAAQLRPAVLHKALDSLTSPPPGTLTLWWTGPLSWWSAIAPLVALLIASHPDLAVWKPAIGPILISWALGLLVMVPLALVPASVVDGTPGALRTAWKAGPLFTVKISALAGFGAAIAFVLSHTILGLVFLPLAQGSADPNRSVALLLIVLGNLFMALAVPAMSVAGGSGWQTARRQAWERMTGVSRGLMPRGVAGW
jgi:hypothetical protein